jgi:hypothetical protein
MFRIMGAGKCISTASTKKYEKFVPGCRQLAAQSPALI